MNKLSVFILTSFLSVSAIAICPNGQQPSFTNGVLRCPDNVYVQPGVSMQLQKRVNTCITPQFSCRIEFDLPNSSPYPGGACYCPNWYGELIHGFTQ